MQQGSILPFLKKQRPSGSETTRPGQPYRSRPFGSKDSSNKGSSTRHHRGPNNRRNMHLKLIADETKAELPNILSQLPRFDAMESSIYDLKDMASLDPEDCPGYKLPEDDAESGKAGTRIKVLDMDTFDVAISLAPEYTAQTHLETSQPRTSDSNDNNSMQQEEDLVMKDVLEDSTSSSNRTVKPVAVLNLASEFKAGGGWQNGALAQEEALCYRSSLYLSLHKSHYPLPSLSAIYSPYVLLIRDAMSRGHSLLTPKQQPADLPVTAVISVAALRRPALTDDKKRFKNEGQRAETKRKIRVTLRVAAMHGHTKLVLGALGCGVFLNPPKEVADCFLEVMREKEFQGGWWEEVAFAVLDNVKGDQGGKDGAGNFGVFYRALNGQIV
ncbi:hypothetical protein GQ44DRAFT_704637 [Phaeosphaeriaceae sp. PMI808]|nr:hypothetical protein GQ44DRAFT_704637 [Phaeosphaeriaceae sp. PMI808]